MTQRVFLGLLTVVVFIAGYGTRMLTERGQGIPPPPAALANEYTAPAAGATAADKAKQEADRARERAKLVAEIEKLRPQIEAYRAQIDETYAEFDREFVQILNAKQREKFTANQKKFADAMATPIQYFLPEVKSAGALASGQKQGSYQAPLSREAQELIRLFGDIKDAKLRQQVIELTRTLASTKAAKKTTKPRS